MFYTRSSFIAFLNHLHFPLDVDNSDYRRVITITNPSNGYIAYMHTTGKDRIHYNEILLIMGKLTNPVTIPGPSDLDECD